MRAIELPAPITGSIAPPIRMAMMRAAERRRRVPWYWGPRKRPLANCLVWYGAGMNLRAARVCIALIPVFLAAADHDPLADVLALRGPVALGAEGEPPVGAGAVAGAGAGVGGQVWFGERVMRRLPVRAVHVVSAGIFAMLGVAALVKWD